MEIHKIIAELQRERSYLDEALAGLERLSLKRAPRRGRPPLRLKLNDAAATQKKERLVRTAE